LDKVSEHIVTESSSQRIADYLIGVFHQLPSKSSIRKAIKAKRITINHQIAATATIPSKGDVISYFNQVSKIKPYPLEVPVIYEDEYYVIVNKPAGLPTSGNLFRTSEAALAHTHFQTTDSNKLSSPRPAHRLDSLTSGLLIAAKSNEALLLINKLFEQGGIQKTYQALVMGQTPESGNWESIIDGKVAKTSFRKLSTVRSLKNDELTLLELSPKTGRTHQLRIHCSEAGFPIYGDPLYADNTIKHKGLFLSSVRLEFTHPVTLEPLEIQIELPSKFHNRMNNEQKRWERKNGNH
tara:strand:- start:4782 stop:5666 length:885 start_codon:yes stop_codon:yes gene_type:complete